MIHFTRRDAASAAITGVTTGFITWCLWLYNGVPVVGGISAAWLIAIVPVLWIAGVAFGYFLGQWIPFFNQFGKFVAVGFTNATVDFGVLYLLIAVSGIATGVYFSLFKLVSFSVALAHSYFWNKFWAFSGASGNRTGELARFFAVTVAALVINVVSASLIVNAVGPLFGLDVRQWAGIGAVVGSAVSLIFSFVGFRLVVFAS